MKKLLITTLTAAALLGGLITVPSTADQVPTKHAVIIVQWLPTYRRVEEKDVVDPSQYKCITDLAGKTYYLTEDGFVLSMIDASENTPKLSLGAKRGETTAFLRNNGFRFTRGFGYNFEVFEKTK